MESNAPRGRPGPPRWLRLAATFGAASVLALLAVSELGARRAEADHPPRGRLVPVSVPDGRGGTASGLLHLTDSGAGGGRPAVVLLHGASGNLSDPVLALGPGLRDVARVIAVDRPGHGWSDRVLGRAAADPATQAALIRAALGAIGVERAVIVGHSLGGAVAASLALDHPDLASGLVLVSAVTHPWPGTVDWWNAPLASERFGGFLSRVFALPLGHALLPWGVRAVFRPNEPPPDYANRAAIPLILRPANFQANAQDLVALKPAVIRRAGEYGRLRVPTAVVAGAADPIVWTDLHARAVAAAVPGATLEVVPEVGHMPHHVATDRVLAAIRDVIARAAAREGEPVTR